MPQAIQEESKLIPIISSRLIPKIRKNNGEFKFLTELNCGYGIADIVFYNLDEDLVSERYKRYPLSLRSSHIQALLAIQEKGLTSISYLTNKLPFSENYIKYNILKFLINNEWVGKKEDEYFLNFRYLVGLKESIAIEAKLKNWQRGFYQAYRYKWFANESYLAIYAKYIRRPIKALYKFKKFNIGLLSVRERGVETIFQPHPENPYSKTIEALSYEEILKHYFRGQFAPTHRETFH